LLLLVYQNDHNSSASLFRYRSWSYVILGLTTNWRVD
jgi:hypothetical protein